MIITLYRRIVGSVQGATSAHTIMLTASHMMHGMLSDVGMVAHHTQCSAIVGGQCGLLVGCLNQKYFDVIFGHGSVVLVIETNLGAIVSREWERLIIIIPPLPMQHPHTYNTKNMLK